MPFDTSLAPDTKASGVISGSQTAELVGGDAFVFQHHGNVVIDAVDPLPVLSNQPFCQRLRDTVIPGVSDFPASNLMIDLSQFINAQGSEWLLGYRATQNL